MLQDRSIFIWKINYSTFDLRLDALDGVEVAVVGGQPQHLMAVIPDQIINLKKLN